jgi:hypothetical protein
MSKETFEDIKSKIARSVKTTLSNEAIPPSGEKPVDFELHVPFSQVKLDDEEDETARASVTYVVRCPTEKKHTVHIKFKYDKSGKFLRNTMVYV